MARIICLTCCLAGFLSGVAWADLAMVTLADGSRLSGELLRESPTVVVLSIAGIERPIERHHIRAMVTAPTAAELYRRKLDQVNPGNVAVRYELTRFLYDSGELDLARTELQRLAAEFPDHAAAKTLLSLVESRQAWERAALEAGGPLPSSPGEQAEQGPPDIRPRLSASQINAIRVWELPADLERTRPRVLIPRATMEEVFRAYAEHPAVPRSTREQARLLGRPGYEQLALLYRLRARDYYDKVQVLEDPPALVEFRRNINPNYITHYFARHFGTGHLPQLSLFGGRVTTLDEAYTNFYMLSTLQHEGQPFIDRIRPERSLLLQWGLPRDVAASPAPDVPGWRPFFGGVEDPRYQAALEWIRSLYDPTPDYNIALPAPESPAQPELETR